MENMVQIKQAKYRQSGWREVSTGHIRICHGTDQPPQDGTFVKLYDQMVSEFIVITPIVETV